MEQNQLETAECTQLGLQTGCVLPEHTRNATESGSGDRELLMGPDTK